MKILNQNISSIDSSGDSLRDELEWLQEKVSQVIIPSPQKVYYLLYC